MNVTQHGDMEQYLIEHAHHLKEPAGAVVTLDEARAGAQQFDQVQERLLVFVELVYNFTSADNAGHMRYLHELAAHALDRPLHVPSQPTIADIREEDEPR